MICETDKKMLEMMPLERVNQHALIKMARAMVRFHYTAVKSSELESQLLDLSSLNDELVMKGDELRREVDRVKYERDIAVVTS